MPLLTFPAAGWLAVATGGIVVARRRQVPALWTRLVIGAAAAMCVVAVGSGVGPLLAPGPLALLPSTAEDDPLASGTGTVNAADYGLIIAPSFNAQFVALVQFVDSDAEGPPDPAVAKRLSDTVKPLVDALDAQVEQVRGADSAVQLVHNDLIASVGGLSEYIDRIMDFIAASTPQQCAERSMRGGCRLIITSAGYAGIKRSRPPLCRPPRNRLRRDRGPRRGRGMGVG